MEVDYNLPLKLECLFIELDKNTNSLRYADLIVYVLWEDIVTMENFVKPYLCPNDTRPKVNVATKNGSVYLVVGSEIDELGEAWAKYRIWRNSLRNMIFTKN
jgi:hypothetical protein